MLRRPALFRRRRCTADRHRFLNGRLALLGGVAGATAFVPGQRGAAAPRPPLLYSPPDNIGENIDQLADGCDVALTNQATVQVRYVDAERRGQSVNDELCVLLVVLGVLGDPDDSTHPHAEHCLKYGNEH